jgi:hypothetical protein
MPFSRRREWRGLFDSYWHVNDTVARAFKLSIHLMITVNNPKRENPSFLSCLLHECRILSGMPEILPVLRVSGSGHCGMIKFLAESKESIVGGRVLDCCGIAL